MIYAIDFDGTLCEDKFPKIGDPIEKTINLVKFLKQCGHELILWTCRNGESLEDAVKWCKEHDLEFDAVNKNLDRIIKEWGGDTRKIYCDYYLDDKNILLNKK